MARSDAVLERLMALHPKVIDLSLDRMHRLLAALGHPERDLPPVVHVAGTNGKGSTVATIRAGLEGAGERVHAYTSPHLARFHERIRLGGALIAEDALADVLAECEAANGDAPITYFEITTCAALLAFARTPADWTLLEVGLGGRLDATNVIAPRLCAITPVAMDHQAFLGDTLEAIAGEKAGILKRGVPCVVGPQEDEALAVIEDRAARVGAPLRIHGQDWHVGRDGDRLVFQDGDGLMDLPLPVLPGPHQIGNAGIAIAALRALGRAGGAEAAVTRTEWPARMQRLTGHPLNALAHGAELWLDGGHNPAAGRAVADTLAAMPPRATHAVAGLLRTKDAAGYFAPLASRLSGVRTVSIPGEAATLSADETAEAANRAGLAAVPSANVEAAVGDIAARAPGARILICGSLYLAGHVLRMG
ncbi:folylpolyglutamate synthase/dihydrofolate synthase family protein [Jannaschia sp. LMIT008]|uniref:bifunctional folylpolyglutamate synthase/dihydrofolate synthase n=1 Tax=Jannaschia maritima TaxID=3032585 RepID=UPI002810BE07|nr:folylpolyglutamate synthase/dihydrofolate synthase family protein [Jannaschia sp. LMIT008]